MPILKKTPLQRKFRAKSAPKQHSRNVVIWLPLIITLPACWFVLCKPEESYSTAAMYRRIDDEQPQCCIDTEGMLEALEAGDLQAVSQRIGNIFESVLPEGSAVVDIRQRLYDLGALRACMSGSGSAVFGLFADERAAATACEAMKGEFPRTWLAKSV